ncbi:MAG: hypothetical protein VW946_02710, partial [Gammaproteobacteria bacterium]
SLDNSKLTILIFGLLISFLILSISSFYNFNLIEYFVYPIFNLPGMPDVRILKLIEVALSGSILLDASAFDRLLSMFKFIFDPYLFPLPRTHILWINDVNEFVHNFFNSRTFLGVGEGYRNISGLGQLNFILGFLFVIPILGLLSHIKRCKKLELFCLNVFFIALFQSTPIANPMIGLSLGLLCWHRKLIKAYIKGHKKGIS